jgi:type IV pilus assembly protein PilW
VYVQSRKTYAINEAVARLQENARYALGMIEPDIRLANHWGMTSDPLLIAGTVGNAPIAVPVSAATCGATFPIDLRRAVDGDNNLNTASWPLACDPQSAVRDATDLLIIRRAETQTAAASANRLQVFTTRSGGASRVFNADAPPAPITNDPLYGPNAEVRNLVARAYYVDQDSVGRPGLPALRRFDLGAGPSIIPEEIMPGVEDLQVQFGLDPGTDSNGDGIADFYTGVTTRYVNPDSPLLNTALVTAVRVWLLVRAETPEVGYTDTRLYNYGDVVDYQPNDGFRRLLVSRTIQVRNTQI